MQKKSVNFSNFFKNGLFCRALGNIVTGSDDQTDAVVKAGCLPILGGLLKHGKTNVVKEAAWTLSNITAGPAEQIQAVIESGLIEGRHYAPENFKM